MELQNEAFVGEIRSNKMLETLEVCIGHANVETYIKACPMYLRVTNYTRVKPELLYLPPPPMERFTYYKINFVFGCP